MQSFVISLLFLLVVFTENNINNSIVEALAIPSTETKMLIIDSHLHVWADSTEASDKYPYEMGQEPPDSLRDVASVSQLCKQMDNANVDGALIVQPINHKFDHTYVANAMKLYPEKFKGMLLHDPSLSPEMAVTRLEELTLQGFVGVRFNPYLWPTKKEEDDDDTTTTTTTSKNIPMSTPNGSGLAVYQRCGELNIPVGVMCFKGLELHYDDIIQLLETSPKTNLILDHFGFTSLQGKDGGDNNTNNDDDGEDAIFQKLVQLAKYPQVYVKISAVFRLQDTSPSYEQVREKRFRPLLEAFGPNRLMFGTDFPFVLEQEPEKYDGMVKLISTWMDDEVTRSAVMGGTASNLFGVWGKTTSNT